MGFENFETFAIPKARTDEFFDQKLVQMCVFVNCALHERLHTNFVEMCLASQSRPQPLTSRNKVQHNFS